MIAETVVPAAATERLAGLRVVADDVSLALPDGRRLLDGISLEIEPGEVVAVIGRSGAGKSTLLDVLAGIRLPTSGSVQVGREAGSHRIASVPQDDIVHLDLSVEATVRYAARLRLPATTSAAEIEETVDRTLAAVDLDDRRRLAVGRLSGGQRKRASIATELVTQPHLCLLDEPTAGLDPLAAARLMDLLRSLADGGTTVIMTTHGLADLVVADRLIVVVDGGRVAFDGPPDQAPDHFGVDTLFEVCLTLESIEAPPARTHAEPVTKAPRPSPSTRSLSGFHQWRVLTRRNFELSIRNRMNLAITVGSPVLVVIMLVVLFQRGLFDAGADPAGGAAISYWITFAGFFFGLTFGLLQICTEAAIVRRERLATIDVGPYLLAKVAVLLPVLAAVNVAMVATLMGLDRLPSLSAGDVARLLAVLLLDSLAGLALGLLASAAVSTAAQAALALPMLCFPAVLFSGAIVPVRSMTGTGRAMADAVSDRWAFEAVGRVLGVPGDPFSHALGPRVLVLGLFIAAFLGLSSWTIQRRTSA